jgi:hypothetical protein
MFCSISPPSGGAALYWPALMDDQQRTGGSLKQIASLKKARVEKTLLTNPALCDHTAFTTGVNTKEKSNT